MFQKLERYARHFSSLSLVFGFVFDFFTLWRIDLWAEDLIFIVYLAVAATCISYLSIHQASVVRGKWADRLQVFFHLALQFCFGGLFGRFFIFYSRSGSLTASWPFLMFLAALLVGNEVLKKRYFIFTYRMSVYFIALFSFAIFYVPIVIGEMSARVFIASGVSSLLIMGGFSWALIRALRGNLRVHIGFLIFSIMGIFGAINIMYATNVIPPLPLSVEAAGVYHELHRDGSDFVGAGEARPWYVALQGYPEVHVAPGETIYVFAAIFAPTKITTTVVHEWQYFDPKRNTWISKGRIPYDIVGGRDGGYRGYTYNTHFLPGRWRVSIRTERGALIGRIKFSVVPVSEPVPTIRDIL